MNGPHDLPRHLPARPMPRPTAQVEAYVEALGPDLAVAFLLEFGGAEMTVSESPNGRSAHEAFIGPETAARLSAIKDKLQRRVPLAKAWLAAMLQWQGLSTAAIARKLRMSDTSVRRMLKERSHE
jgi:hypothetical protein